MRCPKCHAELKEQAVLTQSGEVIVDKCERCQGLWFDTGEIERLRDDWTSVSLDSGDENIGKIYNEITEIDCPRCFKPMKSMNDPRQSHIRYEVCREHGLFMDAGEFTDFREITLKEAFNQILELYKKTHRNSDPDPE